MVHYLHVRFAPEIYEPFHAWLKDRKSAKYVISEEIGTKDQRVHHHAAFESPIGLEAVKKVFQKFCQDKGLQVSRGKSNAWYGGVKECTDTSYICKDGKIVASEGFPTETIAELIAEGKKKYHERKSLILPPDPSGNTTQIVKVVQTKTSMRAKFVKYLASECGWTPDYIRHFNLDARKDEIIGLLTEFWENAFTTPQGVVCVEHAIWVYADERVRNDIKAKNVEAIKKFLRA